MVRVIIVAAGSGSRFGAGLPKQYCLLDGRPVLMRTIDAFRRAIPYADITIVINRDMEELWADLCHKCRFTSPSIAYGGSTRWESVKNAVQAISPADTDIIMVHDGARPIVEAEMVGRILQAMLTCEAAIPVVPVTDSLRIITADGSQAIDRAPLRAVQTPQAFRGAAIKAMYSLPYSPLFTDDASVYEASSRGALAIVPGSPSNLKITHPTDLLVAAALLKKEGDS